MEASRVPVVCVSISKTNVFGVDQSERSSPPLFSSESVSSLAAGRPAESCPGASPPRPGNGLSEL
eukprot:3129871-Pleurochrysis_carterae.AAC.1